MDISNSKNNSLSESGHKVYLWGMAGVGKTTIGKKLAHKMGFQFLDLDHFIEVSEGKSIAEIFANEGENHFRKLESEYLKKAKEGSFVISTGGGTPCFSDNANYMLAQGVCVFLDAPVALIADRLKDSKTVRPLIAGLQSKEEIQAKIQNQFNERISFYSKAHVRVLAHQTDVELLAQAIKTWFSSNK